MEVIAVRGNRIYIVKHNGNFYLLNLDLKSIQKANPPDKPDMFLKFGYFEEVDKIGDNLQAEIITLLQNLSE